MFETLTSEQVERLRLYRRSRKRRLITCSCITAVAVGLAVGGIYAYRLREVDRGVERERVALAKNTLPVAQAQEVQPITPKTATPAVLAKKKIELKNSVVTGPCFRDLKWGTPVEDILGMIPDSSLDNMPWNVTGEWQSYVRKEDELAIGDIQLLSINYGFYQGRLGRIIILPKNWTIA